MTRADLIAIFAYAFILAGLLAFAEINMQEHPIAVLTTPPKAKVQAVPLVSIISLDPGAYAAQSAADRPAP